MKSCWYIFLAGILLLCAIIDTQTFFIAFSVLVVSLVVCFIGMLLFYTPKPIESVPDEPIVPTSYKHNIYVSEDFVYDVDFDNPDYDEIGSIQFEDDEFMARFEEKVSDFEFINKEDVYFWYYNEIKPNKIYTDKYFKKRLRKRIKEEGFD